MGLLWRPGLGTAVTEQKGDKQKEGGGVVIYCHPQLAYDKKESESDNYLADLGLMV